MQTATLSNIKATSGVTASAFFIPLELERRPAVNTAAAAHYLSRRPQTLRGWACMQNGPLRPIRINGRLAWKIEDIRRLLSGGAK